MQQLLNATFPFILALFHIVGPTPADLGVNSGHLSPCTSDAHCASATWAVDDANASLNQLKAVIEQTSGTQILEEKPAYLHATYSSRIFGFIDDLELFVHDNETLEARSVSRLGESDLGVNRQRLNTLEANLRNERDGHL